MLSIKAKLILVISSLIAISFFISLLSLYSLTKIHKQNEEMHGRYLKQEAHLQAIKFYCCQSHLDFGEIQGGDTGTNEQDIKNLYKECFKHCEEILLSIKLNTADDTDFKQNIEKLKDLLNNFENLIIKSLKIKNFLQNQEAEANFDNIYENLEKHLDICIKQTNKTVDRKIQLTNDYFKSAYGWILFFAAFAVIAGLGLGIFIYKSVMKNLAKITKAINKMGNKELNYKAKIEVEDEIGKILKVFNTSLEKFRDSFLKIKDNIKQVSDSSSNIKEMSHELTQNIDDTNLKASSVSSAFEEVNQNMETVATAVEEMNASIKEIAENASKAAKIANNAVEMAKNTNNTVVKLGESSNEIGNVIKVITSIAEQTNLLALNATIEAARAGEYGKGFAVVANEVKELAKETSKATEDIGRKIENIQTDSREAVTAIGKITNVIAQIDDISNTIATAVEEQTSTTGEIGRNITEISKASNEISESITGVAQIANNNSIAVEQAQKNILELDEITNNIQNITEEFNC